MVLLLQLVVEVCRVGGASESAMHVRQRAAADSRQARRNWFDRKIARADARSREQRDRDDGNLVSKL
jgi:hypothetical protein